MKKPILTAATALAVSSLFVFASCGEIQTTFSSNWFANTSLTTSIGDTYERLTYAVEFEKGGNKSASVDYKDGVYTTELTNDVYTWEDGTTDNVYVYKTKLTISVTYTVGGESETYQDAIGSVAVFRTSKDGLRPVYSEKQVKAHSLLRADAVSVKTDIGAYDYTLKTTYNKELTNAKLVVTEKDGSQKISDYKLSKQYSVLDNEQLLFAVRGMNIAASGSTTVSVLNTSGGKVQTVSVRNNGVAAMEPSFTINGNKAEDKEITYNQMSVGVNGIQSGISQVCCYATTVSQTANTYRNVMLVNRSALPYNMGTLVYKLTNAEFSEK